MQPELLVYAPNLSTRFQYICSLVFGKLLGLNFNTTDDISQYTLHSGARLCYNTQSVCPGEEVLIVPCGLLSEKGINSHQLSFIDFEGSKAFFPVYSRQASMPFDVLAASFYMVSRYEEYLPYMRDEHGRFSAKSAVAVQQDFAHIPVVNKWALFLGKLLVKSFPDLILKPEKYQFIPTIDVDAAWAYRNKGLIRTLGGYMKDISRFDVNEFKVRTRVMLKMQKDPFDTFDLLLSLHQQYNLKPWYFILFAGYGPFDKNIPVSNSSFQTLVKSLADYARVGIHPSYASHTNPSLLSVEIDRLSKVLRAEIVGSRQHFLKLSLPETYRNLIHLDITEDFTMGFASHPGFRAGICSSFKWYDLEAETATDLTIHPFALMDGTLRDYMKVDAATSLEIIKKLVDQVKEVNGTFISLWHNESLSGEKRWKGWIEVYKEMLAYAAV